MTSLSAIQIQALVRDMDTSFRKYRGLKESNPVEWAAKIKAENLKLFNSIHELFKLEYPNPKPSSEQFPIEIQLDPNIYEKTQE